MRLLRDCSVLFILGSLSLCAAPRGGTMENLDFTVTGTKIPEAAAHDWNLGATGARGWMYSDKMVTSDARQIVITKVEKGSPADGVLEIGDVILGVNGKKFSYDPRIEMGKALGLTELKEGKLQLMHWRAGKRGVVELQLPILGEYSATAPYDCPKSKLILERGCEALAKRVASGEKRKHPITRSLNALALLASGNDKYLPLMKQEAQWAAEFTSNGYKSWSYSYVTIFLAEYTLATGDKTYLQGLRRLALEISNGQSVVGSWGHRFIRDDGALGGYGMMNSPGIPLTIGLVLAREAGVKDAVITEAIEKSARLIRFYVGKGAVPYGDHHPWIQTHDDNGKCGMAAVLFTLLGDKEATTFFSKMSLACHGSERDTGHTGNFFNMLWAMPGVSQAGPEAAGAWMKEFGSWYYDLARQWDGNFIHQGPPSMRKDSYRDWDCTGAYLLAYAMPLKKLFITGKGAELVDALDRKHVADIINESKGWTNKDRESHYDSLNKNQLIERLASWSPVVRERAAMALKRRKPDAALMAELMSLFETKNLNAKIGVCQLMAHLKPVAAVEPLRKYLKSDDLWLRVKAAEALASIGKPAMSTLPEMLEMLARDHTETDPRGMEQRYLNFAIFDKLLRHSIDGVDRDLLRKAITAGLKNEDGRSRGSIGNIYKKLSFDEIKPLLPAIYDAVKKPAPSGIMFAAGVRLSGLEVLAKNHIKEGMPLCLEVMDVDKWGKGKRIGRCLKALSHYGGAAKPLLPKLREIEEKLSKHREKKNLKPHLDQVKKLIAKIESAKDAPKLIPLK